MKILKCFVDENDWNRTTEAECLEHTEGSGYWASGSVLAMLVKGQEVHTPFARYKVAEQVEKTSGRGAGLKTARLKGEGFNPIYRQ